VRLRVRTPGGIVAVSVPPDTRAGAKLRIRGKGLATGAGDGRGDFYAIIRLVLPADLDPHQRELLTEMAKTARTTVTGGARMEG
jgi:curved DNA-binding protein